METLPLIALSSRSKFLLSSLLNPTKVTTSTDGYPRDWRGLADLFNLSGEIIPSIATKNDPTNYILELVAKNNNSNYTLTDLEEFLVRIGRWDVIDDLKPILETDIRNYLEEEKRRKTSAEPTEAELEIQVLTVDDLYRVKEGLSTQLYNAFLLYADEDLPWAEKIIDVLEKQHQLKLCIKDRDLIAGVTFEHEILMQLISERCNKLIVVYSPSFRDSNLNQFLLSYAQAVSIERREKKIIPCMFEWCILPMQLKHYTILDYNRSSAFSNFWNRLRCSVETAQPINGYSSAKPEVKQENSDTTVVSEPSLISFDPRRDFKEVEINAKEISVPIPMKSLENPRHCEPTLGEELDLKLPSLDGLDPLDSASEISISSLPSFVEKKTRKKKIKEWHQKLKKTLAKPSKE